MGLLMIDIHCRKCGRFLGKADGDTTVTLKCANCKSLERYELVSLHHYYPGDTLISAHKPI